MPQFGEKVWTAVHAAELFTSEILLNERVSGNDSGPYSPRDQLPHHFHRHKQKKPRAHRLAGELVAMPGFPVLATHLKF